MLPSSCHPSVQAADGAFPRLLRKLLTQVPVPALVSNAQAVLLWSHGELDGCRQSTAIPQTEGQQLPGEAEPHSGRGPGGRLGKRWLLVVWRQQVTDLWEVPVRTDTTECAPEQSPRSFSTVGVLHGPSAQPGGMAHSANTA